MSTIEYGRWKKNVLYLNDNLEFRIKIKIKYLFIWLSLGSQQSLYITINLIAYLLYKLSVATVRLCIKLI